jgi:nucleotide-binding universal stress UspA family protein
VRARLGDALSVAARLAHAAGASLRIVSAILPEVADWWFRGETSIDAQIERYRAARCEELERAAEETLRDGPDIDATHVMPQGDPVKELLAASADADLLVVGSRRWGALGRLVLGTVSEAVVREIRCPTLVVPRRHGAEPAVAELAAGMAADPGTSGVTAPATPR